MYILQTKRESRRSGGPQYFLYDVPDHLKDHLRRKGRCDVVLQTPYGIATSKFVAFGKDHKLQNGKLVRANAQHERVQRAGGKESFGEAVRRWYGLKSDLDFERIDLHHQWLDDGRLILIPTSVGMKDLKRPILLERNHSPLSFHRDHQSKIWKKQIEKVRAQEPAAIAWAGKQISRVVEENRSGKWKNVLESDLLRASGALGLLGLKLSPYLGKGYDCIDSCFQFEPLPMYPCPVEIKKRSEDFDYQIKRYTPLPRVVVLCLDHNLLNPPDHVDVLELSLLAKYLVR